MSKKAFRLYVIVGILAWLAITTCWEILIFRGKFPTDQVGTAIQLWSGVVIPAFAALCIVYTLANLSGRIKEETKLSLLQ